MTITPCMLHSLQATVTSKTHRSIATGYECENNGKIWIEDVRVSHVKFH